VNDLIQLKTVQSRAFRLIRPQVIEETIIEHFVRPHEVIIEPTLASICHADLRYYTGNRRPEALVKKLPMALIHEGIGVIIDSTHPEFSPGQRVVIVPNIPGCSLSKENIEEWCPACKKGIGENYCLRGRFLGSGTDGIAQSRLVMPTKCVIPIPEQVPDEIAVLTELCSVSYQALQHVEKQLQTARVAVFGDGPVGYLTAAMIHHLYRVSQDHLRVFGAISEKLDQFQFAERSLVQDYDFNNGEKVDIAVECTGGRFSSNAINQAIQILNPGGFLILMGVSEEWVPINTRDILEKGITIVGSSRSSSYDYPPVLEAMKDPEYQKTLRRIIPEQHLPIRTVEEFDNALSDAAKHPNWKKSILKFIW
jgi:ribitol-5-phosphate 2-dehydrogenase